MKTAQDIEKSGFLAWLDKYQAQLVVLASQVIWSEAVDNALNAMKGQSSSAQDSPLQKCLTSVEGMLTVLADCVLYEQPPVRRQKLEHLIIEHVHQRDVIRNLIRSDVNSPRAFDWLSQMRFYFDPKQSDPLRQVSIQMANAKFQYGFEYLGLNDRLVQTPLTDRCYLTMTQALEARLGGSPFGPAGTGKTESVKALGTQLGRFVLVFNCDETFDFHVSFRTSSFHFFVGMIKLRNNLTLIKTVHNFCRRWVEFLLDCAKLELGDVLMNSIVWKNECFQLFRNRYKVFKRLFEIWQAHKRTLPKNLLLLSFLENK